MTANVQTYTGMAYKVNFCANIDKIDNYKNLESFNSQELNELNNLCAWEDLGWIISPNNKKLKLKFLGETASSLKICEAIGKIVRKPWPEGIEDVKLFDPDTFEYVVVYKPHPFNY